MVTRFVSLFFRAGGQLSSKYGVKYVIHAIAPIVNSLNADKLLSHTVYNSLMLVDKKRRSSVALPAISAGTTFLQPCFVCDWRTAGWTLNMKQTQKHY